MNKLQLNGRIKDASGRLQVLHGRLVGSLDKQAKGIKLQSEGWAMIIRGDEEALADAVLYCEDAVKRRAIWINSRG